jgi:hypothetical protein
MMKDQVPVIEENLVKENQTKRVADELNWAWRHAVVKAEACGVVV